MAHFKVSSFLCVLLLINYSLAVLNNSGNKNENVDVKRTLCVGRDVVHGNDETSKPIVIATENVSSVKVNKIASNIEDRTSIISSEYELPLQRLNNQGPTYTSTKPFHSFDLQLPEVFPPQSQFGNAVNMKRLQFSTHYTPAFPPYRNNQIKSIHVHAIPTSLEAYGPPIDKLIRPYFSSPSKELRVPSSPNQIQNNIHGDLSSNVGIFAPPTPPDIKYDGWRPIPGHISTPNHLSVSEQSTNEHVISSLSSNHNLAQLPGKEVSHSPRQLSEFPTAIPSNSYGEPINDPEDHNLKQSVRQSQISDGLPPPPIPEYEPFHVNQGPTTMIFSTSAPSVANTINDQHHQNGLEPLQLPDIDDNLPGLFRPQSARVQLNNNNINNNGFSSENDLLLQQLPPFNNGPFTGFLDSVDELGSSYLAPPPSSFSSSGPYPSSRRPSYFAAPFRKPFKLKNSNIPKFMLPRNRGTFRSQVMFPAAPLIGNFIPPRNLPHVNFRPNISPQLPLKSIHNNHPLSSTSLISSGIYDSTFGNNFIKNVQYSTSFDSYGSSSSNQPESTDFPTSNQPKLEDSTEQTNEIIHDKSNYKFEKTVNDDIKPSSFDAFENFHHENGEAAQALALALSSDNVSSDSIQIQGSKDSYTLQIESAIDGQKMENIDGTIKHDQILSERLLHDIITAIEQPGNGASVQVLSNPPAQSLEEIHEQPVVLSPPSSSPYSLFLTDTADSKQAASQLNEKFIDSPFMNDQKEIGLSSSQNNAALFFNNHYEESMNGQKFSSILHDEKANKTNTNL